MKAYISGGAKNGKSTLAQTLAVLCAKYEEVSTGADGEPIGKFQREKELPLYYIATMIPTDEEDRMRIARHMRDRAGLGFITVERAEDINGIIEREGDDCLHTVSPTPREEICCSAQGVFLLDSVTALLANKMFPPDAEGDFWFNPNAAEEVAADLKAFIAQVDNAVFVSDYIYADPLTKSGASRYGEDYTGTYMRGLAYIDRTVAALCDEVYEVSAGIVIGKYK